MKIQICATNGGLRKKEKDLTKKIILMYILIMIMIIFVTTVIGMMFL